MPRLFMHLQNGEGYQRDEQGRDYPSDDAAVHQAARSAAAILSDDLIAERSPSNLEMVLARENGSQVAKISISATIERVAPSTS